MNSEIRFIICQINSHVGNIGYNKDKIIQTIKDNSSVEHYTVFIFPELVLSGYIPLDQLYYADFHRQIEKAIDEIKLIVKNDIVIFGAPRIDKVKEQDVIFNSAFILQNQKIIKIVDKTLLPNYDVFHEKRYFIPGKFPEVFDIFGIKVGMQICEDMWDQRPEHSIKVTDELVKQGAQLIINISASPYYREKPKDRLDVIKNHIKRNKEKINFVYCNLVGSQDEIVFDGRSFIVDKKGDLVSFLKPFNEDKLHFGYDVTDNKIHPEVIKSHGFVDNWDDEVFMAITLNLTDYLRKNHLGKNVLIALSGGIDSALTTVLAVKILGNKRVKAVYLPSKFSSEESRNLSIKLANKLGIRLLEIPITDIHQRMITTIFDSTGIPTDFTIADENIQPRIRSTILMYLSNKENSIVLATGNKSEIACGYTTLYGDTIGAKNLIGDLFKTEVYSLANHLNQENELIPSEIIQREPTAELKTNQKDSDSLPKYDVLDQILKMLIEDELTIAEVVSNGHDERLIRDVLILIRKSEFKRSQICQTVKLKRRTFGIGRLYPVTSGFVP